MSTAPPAAHGLAGYIRGCESATAKRQDWWPKNVNNCPSVFLNSDNYYAGWRLVALPSPRVGISGCRPAIKSGLTRRWALRHSG